MKKSTVFALAVSITSSIAFSKSPFTKETMMAFVEESAKHIEKVGKDKAFKDFQDLKGKFVRENGELYMFCNDFEGISLVLPPKPENLGTNMINTVDPDGIKFVQKMIEMAKKNNGHGSGTVKYHFVNPKSKKVEKKEGYVKGFGNFFCGSGVYLD